MNSAPPSGRLRAVSVSPCRSAIARQIDSPRPEPVLVPAERRAQISRRCVPHCPAAIPAPESLTETTRMSCSRVPTIRMSVAAGVCSAAFSIRLTNSFSISTPSTCRGTSLAVARLYTTRAPITAPTSFERSADQLFERIPLPVERHTPGMQPRHLEQVTDFRAHAHRALINRLEQLILLLQRHALSVFTQAARAACDDGERRAQVVRQRCEQRTSDALIVCRHFGLSGALRFMSNAGRQLTDDKADNQQHQSSDEVSRGSELQRERRRDEKEVEREKAERAPRRWRPRRS